MEPVLISVRDAAAAIGCCRATLYKLLNQGKLRAVKQGARTLIPADALKAYVATLEVESPFVGTITP